MKKWLYLAALLATCYLNLVYDWPEGRTILVVELVFPAVLYLEAKLMSVRIKIRPQGDLHPFSNKLSVRWLPINPSAPVTSTFFILYSSFFRLDRKSVV